VIGVVFQPFVQVIQNAVVLAEFQQGEAQFAGLFWRQLLVR
jgi:hypothetical protein